MMRSAVLLPGEAEMGTYIMVGDSVKYEAGFGRRVTAKGRAATTAGQKLDTTKSATAALNLTDEEAIRQLKLVSKARKTQEQAMKDYISNGPMLGRWANPSEPPRPPARKERARTATNKSRVRMA